jgi:hypothetical protein
MQFILQSMIHRDDSAFMIHNKSFRKSVKILWHVYWFHVKWPEPLCSSLALPSCYTRSDHSDRHSISRQSFCVIKLSLISKNFHQEARCYENKIWCSLQGLTPFHTCNSPMTHSSELGSTWQQGIIMQENREDPVGWVQFGMVALRKGTCDMAPVTLPISRIWDSLALAFLMIILTAERPFLFTTGETYDI